MKPHRNMTRDYADDLRLHRTRASQIGLVLMLAVWLLVPYMLTDDYWLSVLDYAGIAAVGALGLNLLTGYTGQVSLGHAFFIGAGAYAAARLGGQWDLPLPLWLLGAGIVGGLIGAAIGPFALRLRGNYLAIVTLALIYIGDHIFRNVKGLTGGNNGIGVMTPTTIGPVDFSKLEFGGQHFSRNQGYFWLVWGLVAIIALLCKNLVRTRPGRALQAVRDKDVAAEIIGVRIGRYKVGAFAVSSAIAAVGGALLGSYQQYVSPDQWSLFLSIQYIAIIIVGGVGTVFGSVLGALFLGGLPGLIEKYAGSIPGVSSKAGGDGFISVFSLEQAIFGIFIIGFLVFEPRGLAAICLRVKAYFKAWPFSY
jgi:branched-chain amino acid transport system permease protein